MPTTEQIKTDAAYLKAKFENEWGIFRRFLSAHPLTCFWGALAAGLVIGHLV